MSRRRAQPERGVVHELEPELRDRLLSLDEPVARPDWRDVLSRVGSARPSSSRRARVVRVALVAAVACVAAAVVAPAMGLRFGGIVDFWAAPPAPRAADTTFAANGLQLPPSFLRGLQVRDARRVAVEAFRGDTERLFVAPRTGGGFCYEWATQIRGTGVWADELGGCGVSAKPMGVAFDDTRFSVVARRALVDRVLFRLDDGRVVQPTVHWVSAPVSAGFVLYQPPAHVHVAEVEAVRGSHVVARVQIARVGFQAVGS
jgi:hypothetical protein